MLSGCKKLSVIPFSHLIAWFFSWHPPQCHLIPFDTSVLFHPMTDWTLPCAAPFSLFIPYLVNWCASRLQYRIKVRVAALWSYLSCSVWRGRRISYRNARLSLSGRKWKAQLILIQIASFILIFSWGFQRCQFFSQKLMRDIWSTWVKKMWGTRSCGLLGCPLFCF